MSPLPEWRRSDLPQPPAYTLRNVVRVIGPGAILLGLSLGSGDWMLGPAATAHWGPQILWICTASVLLQALLNTEMGRYTLATGEPVFAGFMRVAPGPRLWGPAYALLHLAQVGWPGWALAAASALTAAFLGRMPRGEDQAAVLGLGYAIFLGAVAVTLLGAKARRTIEIAEWIVMAWTLGFLALLALLLVPGSVWLAVAQGFVSPVLPAESEFGVDWVLLTAFAAYSGAGGTINATLTYWLRDKGFGMAGTVEGRPVIVGPETLRFSRDGTTFEPTDANLVKWRLWWRYLRTDCWYLWTAGCLASMALPTLLAAHLVAPGAIWTGSTAPTWLAQAIGWRYGVLLWTLVLLTGFAILALTQLGIVDGYARCVAELVWTARARRRAPGAEVPAGWLYYAVLVAFTAAGCVAMTIADPFRLILIGACVAALNSVLLSVHTLWINRALLPRELRPSLWRELGVLACGVFFAILLVKALREPAWLSSIVG